MLVLCLTFVPLSFITPVTPVIKDLVELAIGGSRQCLIPIRSVKTLQLMTPIPLSIFPATG